MKFLSTRSPVLLAGVILFVTACGEQRQVLAPDFATSAVVVSAPPGIPHATYAMTLGPDDFPFFFPPEVVGLLSGNWELDLTDPRRYVTRLNGDVVVEGRYTSNGARLVKRDLGGPLACSYEPQLAQGVYDWALNDGELTLTVVKDHCEGRPFVLTVKSWQQQ
jgi:hypothetical protein